MNWLNLSTTDLTSATFLGCEPVDRATWLCLMAYCAIHETGGIIVGCAGWGDRMWQQVAGVTKDEVHRDTTLWTWADGGIVVQLYPVGQEAVVRAKRQGGLTRATQREEERKKKKKRKRKEKERTPDRTPSRTPTSVAEIESIYQLYPRKMAKNAALKAIESALKTVSVEDLAEAVKSFATCVEGCDSQFVPYPASWFNAGRWTDDREEWARIGRDNPRQPNLDDITLPGEYG